MTHTHPGAYAVLPERICLAEAGEPPPDGGLRFAPSDLPYHLAACLNHAELSFTDRAAELLATYPLGSDVATLVSLVRLGRLEMYDTSGARVLHGGMMFREEPREEPAAPTEPETTTAWIEVELVDEDQRPIPGEQYRVILPDGTRREGALDAQGRVRIDGFEPGTCHISFPELRRSFRDRPASGSSTSDASPTSDSDAASGAG